MVSRIVVGSDGSETARAAVRQAAQLAAATGASLTIVRAYQDGNISGVAPYLPSLDDDEETKDLPRDVPRPEGARAEALAGLEAEVAEAAQAGVQEVIPEARAGGDPADVILSVAEETGADLIAVGSKGMTGAARFLLGSVPNKLTHHASCNVLVFRTT
jgi:nucleotide-binding universal stress UspA family protein